MDKIIASLVKEGGFRLLASMVFGVFFFGASTLIYCLVAATYVTTTRSHGQESGLAIIECGLLGCAAGLAIAGSQCRQWLWTLAFSALATALIAGHIVFGWFQWNRGGWDDSNYIIFPPFIVAIGFNAILLPFLGGARILASLEPKPLASGDPSPVSVPMQTDPLLKNG